MSARRSSPSLRRRALGALGAGALTGALVLAVLAVVTSDETTVAVDVEPALAESAPTTVPLRPAPRTSRPTATPPSTPSTELPTIDVQPGRSPVDDARPPEPDATSRLSPLADLLDEPFSAVLEATAPRPRPTGLQIDSIDVSRFPVRPVGLEADGQLEVPDETEIGWYRYGSTPGQEGATVIAAHVSWNRTAGPFALLGTVDPGDSVEVQLDDGSVRRYEVVERAIHGKYGLPTDRIWRTSGPEELVLITCGGDFNPEIRRYRDNIVVYAVPVG